MFGFSITYENLQQRLRDQEKVLTQRLENHKRAYPLLIRDQVPTVYREFGIHRGYRKPVCSSTDCIRSAFYPTNETLNFWTHFIPFWYFLYQLKNCLSDGEFAANTYHWPYIAYLVTCCFYPFVSCFAHLMSIMSPNIMHICFFFDYFSLSWYSFGVSIVYHAYCFDEYFFNSWYSRWFVTMSATSALLCTWLSCKSRLISTVEYKKLMRITAFILPYVTVSSPLLERIGHCLWTGCADPSIAQHTRQFIWAGLSVVLYMSHFPECLAPGKFDILGHSHQIFHICGILATYDQLWATYADMEVRKGLFMDSNAMPSGRTDLRWVIFVFAANLAIVTWYSWAIVRRSKRAGYVQLKPTTDDDWSLRCKEELN